MQEYGISARLTFSNSLLREEHLSDRKCNALCALFAQSSGVENGVILHSELLLDYLRTHYPQLYLVSSTTKVLTDFRQLRDETAREEFRYVVPDFRLNKAFAQLDSLTQPQKDKVEFLCNECCWVGCRDRKRGDFVGSFATYGYRKDPTNHSKLIVDELAAENVQSIFRWKISGMSNQGIADRLNAKKVPSPAARKLQSGAKLSLHFRKSDEPPWSAKAVDRILHNEVYIGKLVQGKTRRLDYRSKKKMNVPMRDWVIVDNTHEAIIPAEQFELVRRILETETRRPNNAETVALFAGFLYCGDCGSRLVRRSASYKGKRYIYYQCSGSKQNKGSCTSHNLRDEKLYNIVRNALQMQIQIVMEEAEFVESIRQAQQEPYRVRRIERQIRQLTAEKAHTQGIKEKLYGDYAEKILTREDFLNYNELYSKRIEEYNRKITELEAEQRNLQTAPNAYPFLDVYRKYRKLEEITRPMIVELIEKIEVYEGNRVEITFRFQDEIADLLEELHQKQMGQHEVSA